MSRRRIEPARLCHLRLIEDNSTGAWWRPPVVVRSSGAPKWLAVLHVVSSYSCPTCCPDRGPYGGFDPTSYGLFVSDFAPTGSHGEMFDCYGTNYPQNIWWYTL